MKFFRIALLPAVACLALALGAHAQNPVASERITSVVDETQLVTLHGNVPSLVHAEFDLGAVSAETQMTHMRLVLSRTAAQQQALEQLMAEQQDPRSPNYRHWLTPQEFGAQFGVGDADINTLRNWLTSFGFTVERIDSGRMSIAFAGNVGQVENAFHTRIHQFNADGEEFFSNVTEPRIPAALAPVVSGVARLNTIMPKPLFTHGPMARLDENTKTVQTVEENAHPLFTSSTFLYVTPQDAATIYNSPISAGFPGTSSNNGNGISIGIGGVSTIQLSTVWNYRNIFLGQTKPSVTTTTEPCGSGEADCTGTVAVTQQGLVTMYNLDVTAANSAQDEAYIDTELSGGLAPGAKVNYYASNDLWSAIEQMIHDNRDNVFSLSFGSCESGMGTSMNSIVNNWWTQASAQGISVFVSTGDSGSAGCDYNVSVTTGGLAVNGLASTPFNVAVGGTDYDVLPGNFSTYVNSTNSTYYGSAKSFIPEATWNNSTTVNQLLAQNVLNTSSPNSAAGSGGKSSCALTGCKGYAKPSWQTGTGVPADGVRDIPDISLFAANGYYAATWLVCTDDAVNGTTSNCASGYIAGFGGTSTSAPATAGIFALLDQAQGKSIGLPNSQLYTLANGTKASSIFHDTTVGNIAVPCNLSKSPSGSCAAVTGGSDFTTGYNTTTGFDLATGWGSLNIAQLLANWGSGGGGKSTATVTVTPSTGSITYGQSVNVTASVAGSKGTPTGTVTLTAGTYNSGAQTLASGSYIFSIPARTLPVNSYTLTVSYSGDTNYNTASGTSSLTVTKATPTISLGTSASSVVYGTSVTLTATISAGTTGNVSFQDTYNGVTTTIGTGAISSGTAKLVISTLKTGSHSIKAVYGGDTNNAGATSSAVAVTVSQATPTISLSVTKNNPTYGTAITFTATLPSTATGSVTFKDGSTSIGTGTVVGGKATLVYNKLSVASHSITAAYAGDVDYKAATSTALAVTVSKATPSISVASSANPAKTGTSVTFTATISAPAGVTAPSGKVTFKDGTTVLGTGTIASGKATYSTSALAKGTHSITAAYGGDGNYLTATSSVLTQTMN